MSREKRKQKRRTKRQTKARKERQYARQVERKRREREQYPDITIEAKFGTREFVDCVRQAASSLDFKDRNLFSNNERNFLELIREIGIQNSMLELRQLHHFSKDERTALLSETLTNIGEAIFERIPPDILRRFLPLNHFSLQPRRKRLVLTFSSILSQPYERQRFYYSRREPTVEVGGESKVVAFSSHAIERIGERLVHDALAYRDSSIVHQYFDSCVYFEPVTLYGGQPAFVLYNYCSFKLSHAYDVCVRRILGQQSLLGNGAMYYKVGYCPVIAVGRLALAKTFLPPGYTGTPEYGLIISSELSNSERACLLASISTTCAGDVTSDGFYETTKWFHDEGVPQVKQIKQVVFDL